MPWKNDWPKMKKNNDNTHKPRHHHFILHPQRRQRHKWDQAAIALPTTIIVEVYSHSYFCFQNYTTHVVIPTTGGGQVEEQQQALEERDQWLLALAKAEQ